MCSRGYLHLEHSALEAQTTSERNYSVVVAKRSYRAAF